MMMSLRFRICNFLYRDLLRNYLAIDSLAIKTIAKSAKINGGQLAEWQIKKLNRIAGDIDWIMSNQR